MTASTSVLMILFTSSAIALSFYFQVRDPLSNLPQTIWVSALLEVLLPCFAAALGASVEYCQPAVLILCWYPRSWVQGLLNTSYAVVLAPLCFVSSLTGRPPHPAAKQNVNHPLPSWVDQLCDCNSPEHQPRCTSAGVLLVGRLIRRTGRVSIIVLLLSGLIILGCVCCAFP